MTYVLKSIISADCDLRSYSPPNAEEFIIPIEMEIGSKEEEGADLFQALVVPLIDEYGEMADSAVIFLPKYQIAMKQWSFIELKNAIENVIRSYDHLPWPQAAEELARTFKWEFSNYTP